jgi:hypothetical protein
MAIGTAASRGHRVVADPRVRGEGPLDLAENFTLTATSIVTHA